MTTTDALIIYACVTMAGLSAVALVMSFMVAAIDNLVNAVRELGQKTDKGDSTQ